MDKPEVWQKYTQCLRNLRHAGLHDLVDAAHVRIVVAQRQEQRVGMLEKGTGMANLRMAQIAQISK